MCKSRRLSFQNWNWDAIVTRGPSEDSFFSPMNGHIGDRPPTILFIIGPRMVHISWAHSPVSLQHVSFWWLLLNASLAMYHWNIHVQLRRVTAQGSIYELQWNFKILLKSVIPLKVVQSIGWGAWTDLKFYLGSAIKNIYCRPHSPTLNPEKEAKIWMKGAIKWR